MSPRPIVAIARTRVSMKRTLYASILAFLIVMTGLAVAQEDLGAIARQQRQTKRPSAKKVYTNDDIASRPMPAAEPAPADAKAAPATDAKTTPKPSSADD